MLFWNSEGYGLMRTTVGRIGSTSRPGLPCHLWNTYYTCNIMWHTMDSSCLFIRASCFLGQSRGSPKARNGVLCARSCLEQKWDWYADSTSFQQACVFRHSDIHLLESLQSERAPMEGNQGTPGRMQACWSLNSERLFLGIAPKDTLDKL